MCLQYSTNKTFQLVFIGVETRRGISTLGLWKTFISMPLFYFPARKEIYTKCSHQAEREDLFANWTVETPATTL
jgi:hypothetical protein